MKVSGQDGGGFFPRHPRKFNLHPEGLPFHDVLQRAAGGAFHRSAEPVKDKVFHGGRLAHIEPGIVPPGLQAPGRVDFPGRREQAGGQEVFALALQPEAEILLAMLPGGSGILRPQGGGKHRLPVQAVFVDRVGAEDLVDKLALIRFKDGRVVAAEGTLPNVLGLLAGSGMIGPAVLVEEQSAARGGICIDPGLTGDRERRLHIIHDAPLFR